MAPGHHTSSQTWGGDVKEWGKGLIMLVKIKAREFQLEAMTKELKHKKLELEKTLKRWGYA